jgi:AraC family transcriptional regulator
LNERLSPGQFFGARLGTRAVGGFILTEFRYPPHLSIGSHSHALPYFSLVVRGSYAERCDSRTQWCSAASLTFHPAGESHADRFGNTGARVFSIEIDSQWMERIHGYGVRTDRPIRYERVRAVELARRLCHEARSQDSVAELVIEALAMELVAELPRRNESAAEPHRPGWLDAAIELLRADGRAPALRAIATAIGVHPVRLARAFRRSFHCSVGEYARSQQVAQACRLLDTSSLSLSEVALAAGYADQSHLTRALKRTVGVTPANYRRRGLAKRSLPCAGK